METDEKIARLTLAKLEIIDQQMRLGLLVGAAHLKAQSDTVRAMQASFMLQALAFIEQCPEQAKQVNDLMQTFSKIADSLERAAVAFGQQMHILCPEIEKETSHDK